MIRWPLGLYRVVGDSMRPTYRPGDVLLGARWARPRVGQVVVALVGDRPLIKRVAAIDHALIQLAGDNMNESVDSRHFGAIDRSSIRAVIVGRLATGDAD